MIRIVISDDTGNPGAHGLAIKNAIVQTYGAGIEDQIVIINGYNNAKAYINNNPDVIALIRSYAGVADFINDAKAVYPKVLYFLPMGANSFTELNIFQSEEPPLIVTSGAGDLELQNHTAYGKGLEFWDSDLSDDLGTDDMSSYSNGVVLGKLLKIKDSLNCPWWEARFRARMTTARAEPNRTTSPWDIKNGYGRINVPAAIAYKGLIPADPYSPVVTIGNDEVAYTLNPPAGYSGTPVTATVAANTFYAASKELANYIALKKAIDQAAEEENDFAYIHIMGLKGNFTTIYGPAKAAVINRAEFVNNKIKFTVDLHIDEFTLSKSCIDVNVESIEAGAEIINNLYKELLKTAYYSDSQTIEV
jgi:hypothetical protein